MATTAPKVFIPLENNPTVMTRLAHKLGLPPTLSFHDLLSLTDEDLLAFIPRPAHALLFIYPETPGSRAFNNAQKAADAPYTPTPNDPVLWFPQTITNACGLMGLLHCATNEPARSLVVPGSTLDALARAAASLDIAGRAALLENSAALEEAHERAAAEGDTVAPPRGEEPGHAFIAFVRGADGHLYELDGGRAGPVDCGVLPEGEDVLGPHALEIGPMRYLKREEEWGSAAFSCTVLAETMD